MTLIIWLTSYSADRDSVDGPAEVLLQRETSRSERVDQGVSLDCVPPKSGSGSAARSQHGSYTETSIEPYPSAEGFPAGPSCL